MVAQFSLRLTFPQAPRSASSSTRLGRASGLAVKYAVLVLSLLISALPTACGVILSVADSSKESNSPIQLQE